jgi:hypothetical protein
MPLLVTAAQMRRLGDRLEADPLRDLPDLRL